MVGNISTLYAAFRSIDLPTVWSAELPLPYSLRYSRFLHKYEVWKKGCTDISIYTMHPVGCCAGVPYHLMMTNNILFYLYTNMTLLPKQWVVMDNTSSRHQQKTKQQNDAKLYMWRRYTLCHPRASLLSSNYIRYILCIISLGDYIHLLLLLEMKLHFKS